MNKICLISVLLSSFLFTNILSSQDEAYIVRFQGIPSNASVYDIKVLPDNTKIAATDIGIYSFSSFTQNATHIAEGSYNSLAGDNKNELWAGQISGKLRHIATGNVVSLMDKPLNIRSLTLVKSLLWVATDEGVFIINTRNDRVIRHYEKGDNGLRSNDIRFIHADDEYVWVGTTKGIHRVQDDNWKHYEKQKRMDVIFNNHEGNWLISEDEMWVIDPFQRWYPAALDKGLKLGPVRDLTIDKSGKLYIASEKLVRYDPYEEVIHDYESSIGTLSKKCLALACDMNDDIWIGTNSAGLYIIRFEALEDLEFSASIILEKSILCEGSQATILAEIFGGKEPFNYAWNNGKTTSRNESLAPGDYVVSITDASGDSTTASITLLGPVPIRMNIEHKTPITAPGKSDGTANIIIEGGKGPFSVRWDNGEKGEKAIALSSGTHSLTITDGSGCSAIRQIEIEREKFIPNLNISQLSVGQTLLINELYFQADSTEVMESSYDVLEEIYEFLDENAGVVIEIGGHTNNIPPHEYCDKLSSDRARSVALYLFNKGISEDRISYKGYGKRNPIASNASLAGRKKNQRVEIKVLSID